MNCATEKMEDESMRVESTLLKTDISKINHVTESMRDESIHVEFVLMLYRIRAREIHNEECKCGLCKDKSEVEINR